MGFGYPSVRRLLDLPTDWRDREIFRSSAGSLSFGAMREVMLRVSRWLSASAGVRAGERVAMCLPKCLESAQILYGIHAAGAAYVPLPHQGPSSRLTAMLRSIEPQLLFATPESAAQLTAEAGAGGLPPMHTLDMLPDGRGLDSFLQGIPAAKTIPELAADDLAAIMFTSGSTGDPKGVMRPHGSVPTIDWLQRAGQVRAEDRFISTTALHYSSSLDIFFPPCSGCSVYLASDREVMFPDHVTQLIERERATIWIATTTAVRLAFENGGMARRDLAALRRIGVIGEPAPITLLQQLMSALPQVEFVNIYGTTEAPSMTQYFLPRPLPKTMTSVPLGTASRNYEIQLCNEEGAEVAVGEVGEICATSGPVMLGYWGDPASTLAKRLNGRPNSYRTGDLAYVGSDGLFHLVGRKDQMVKLRGQRFDLGEIETVLTTHPAVREAAAFAVPGRSADLEIRAVVLVGQGIDLEGELRRHCARRLPAAARPVEITAVTAFPQLPSGKIDRRALKLLASRN